MKKLMPNSQTIGGQSESHQRSTAIAFTVVLMFAFLLPDLVVAAVSLRNFGVSTGAMRLRPGGGIIVGPGSGYVPPIPPQPDPLVLRDVGTTWIEIAVHAPASGTSRLYRQVTGGPWLYQQSPPAGTRTVVRDDPLPVGTRYCYRLDTTTNGQTSSDYLCAETDWRVGFEHLRLDAVESSQVLALFDWYQTRPLPVGSADSPAIYYMNILVADPQAIHGLWRMGIHVQSSPIFPQELAVWNAASGLVTAGQEITGRWYFAVVPGAIYNDLRDAMLDQLASGEPPGIRALVFRRIPVAAARTYTTDRHNLSYTYLGEQGFYYNAYVGCGNNLPEGFGCSQQEIVGWIVRKVAYWVAEGVETVVEGVRGAIGRITRLIHGEVTLGLQLQLLNTDPAFGNTPMVSAWRGTPLQLAGVRVHVRQGLAAFYGTTDANGHVEIEVAKGANTTVCVETENSTALLTELLTEELVCFGTIGEVNTDRVETIPIQHPYFNVLAAMTDAREYLRTVVGHEMPKITVLVGGMADKVAALGRSFAPCMGRVPNLGLGGGGELAAAIFAGPIGLAVSGAVEFLYAVDIVLRTDSHDSRGVAVHEYGHTVMCDMLLSEGLSIFEVAWTDVILATANQSADNDATYLNEAFADFFTSQVVGGTNYFPPTDFVASLQVNYCNAGSDCLDENFDELDQSGLTGNSPAFQAQVRRVATLLHDAFDGSTDRIQPNDGSHWDTGSLPLGLNSRYDSDRSDESIILDGSALRMLFSYWSSRGSVLREHTFLGGLADMLLDTGYTYNEVCNLFALHASSTTCPAYVPGAPVSPWLAGDVIGQQVATMGRTSSGFEQGSAGRYGQGRISQ